MEKWLKELMEMIQKNDEYDPWIDNVDLSEALKTVEEELQELKESLENDEMEGMVEEIGDLIWTAMLLILVAKRSMEIDPEDVVLRLKKKMKARKPYIFEGYKPSLGVARKIWKEAKERGE